MKQVLKGFVREMLHKRGYVLIQATPKLGRPRTIQTHLEDYIRLSSLEFAAEEIQARGLSGSVAEVGVYRGDFAKWVNCAFPDRKFYLFDTFEGFDDRDAQTDRQRGYSKANEAFTTSVDLVMGKMKFPDNCIVKKGWFPETAQGVTDRFVFVSLDVDLYQPMLSGLEFFYPLLVEGGYIFVHDYNNKGYKGVKPALREFSTKHNINFLPLTDGSGSAVIAKSGDHYFA